MNYYLFAFLCMVGVIVILGFFSLVIYLSGLIINSVGEKGSREKESREETSGEDKRKESVIKTTGATGGEMEEELKKVAAIAAVTAMLESGKSPKSKISERRIERKARYPSPWMMVRE